MRAPRGPAMRGRPGVAGMVFFAAFLVLPTMAVWRVAHAFDWRVLLLYFFTLSFATIILYWHDKKASRVGAWRTPESVLHLAELGGGWAAAYIAQQVFRHKTSKGRYQVIFWLIGFLHQYAALDFLLGWRISREMFG